MQIILYSCGFVVRSLLVLLCKEVAPGAIRTPMLSAALESMGITKADIIPTMSLIGRLGEPRAALNSYKQAVDRVGFLF